MTAETIVRRPPSFQEPTRRRFLEMTGFTVAASLLRRPLFLTKETEASKRSLITVRNGQFYQHGRPVGFVGANWYSLGENNTNADRQICEPVLNESQRKQWMRDARSL